MRLLTFLLFSLAACTAQARSAADYLPADADLDPAIPTPESVLGWEVGDWHVGHDALVNYLYRLAEASLRVSSREIGRSHERRPLLQLTISSEANPVQSMNSAFAGALTSLSANTIFPGSIAETRPFRITSLT